MKNDFLPPHSHIELVMDNERAISFLSDLIHNKFHISDKLPQAGKKPAVEFCRIVSENNISLSLHKVKAHSLSRVPNADDNSWPAMNRLVDLESRRHMRNVRDEFLGFVKTPEGRENKGILFLHSNPSNPFTLLEEAWSKGLVKARHVRWFLEKAVAEERYRNMEEHAQFVFPTLSSVVLHSPISGETIRSFIEREFTAEEEVAYIWPLISDKHRLLKANGKYLLARPEMNTSVRIGLERRAELLGYNEIRYENERNDFILST
jgi:hypothetical protein